MDGEPVTLTVPEGSIYSLKDACTANAYAKEYAQALANAQVKCKEQCYFVICVEFVGSDDQFERPYGYISNQEGMIGLIRTSFNAYRFTVKATCNPEASLFVQGYTAAGSMIALGELELEVGNFILVDGMDLALFDVVILDLNYGPGFHLIDSKNVNGERRLIPGITCDYNKTNLVVGQALGCLDLPCGVGFTIPEI